MREVLLRLPLRVAAGFLLLQCSLWAGFHWLSDLPGGWPRFTDDAYYYQQIARNVINGHGFTVDRLNQTNGFQPLWMLVQVAVARFTAGNPEFQLASARVQGIILLALAGWMLVAFLQPLFGSTVAATGALILSFPRFMNLSTSGMEAAIVLPVLLAFMRHVLATRSIFGLEPSRRDSGAGLWLALLMLARLDSVFILFSVAMFLVVKGISGGEGTLLKRMRGVVLKGLAVFWPVLVIVTPYLSWNVIRYGHLLPVSGFLKSSFPHPGFHPEFLKMEFVALWGLALVASLLPWLGVQPRTERWELLCLLTAGVTLHLVHTVLFMNWAVFLWHFVTYIPVGIFGAAVLLAEVEKRVPSGLLRVGALGLALVQVVALGISVSRAERNFRGASIEAGRWVDAHLPRDTVLAMKDSGAFSFFSGRQVVNLDGVANNFSYQRRLCSGQLADYLDEKGVQYIAQHDVPPEVRNGTYETYNQIYRCGFPWGKDGSLRLQREDEIFRGSVYLNNADREGQLIIWRLPLGRRG